MVQGEQEAAEALQEAVMEVAMAQEKETVQWEDLVQATVQEVQAEVEVQDHHHPHLPLWHQYNGVSGISLERARKS